MLLFGLEVYSKYFYKVTFAVKRNIHRIGKGYQSESSLFAAVEVLSVFSVFSKLVHFPNNSLDVIFLIM